MTHARPTGLPIFTVTLLTCFCTSCQPITSPSASGYPAAHSVVETAYPAPAGIMLATVIQRTLIFPLPPEAAPAPQTGKASLSGLLFSITTLTPIADTMFYLTPAVGDQRDRMPPLLAGPDPARGDLAGRSLDDGSFQFDALAPGSYFIIVSAPGNWCEAIRSDADPSPWLIGLSAGQRLPLGVIPVRWP